VEADRRFDGKFVLRTNTKLSPAEVAKIYKGLWRWSAASGKKNPPWKFAPFTISVMRPASGTSWPASRLRLEVDLSMPVGQKGIECSWPDLMRDLKRLQAVHLDLDGRSYRIRTDFEGVAYQAFKAAGVQRPAG